MSKHAPPPANQEQIGRLHDALTWLTTPADPERGVYVRRQTLAAAEIPQVLRDMFPETSDEVLSYQFDAFGVNPLESCLHRIGQATCVRATIARQSSVSSSAIEFAFTPFMPPNWELAHDLTRTFPEILGNLALGPGEQARYTPNPRIIRAIPRGPETPTAPEVDGLIELTVAQQ